MSQSSKNINKATFELMDALSSPILTHAQSWADAIPERLINLITISRMAALARHEELATYPECVAFIMTRSMEAPMSSDWVEIYTHLSCSVAEQYWGENHWEQVMAPKTLTDYQTNYLLLPLRRWIYDKRRKALKERMKHDKVTEKPVIHEKQQLTLF